MPQQNSNCVQSQVELHEANSKSNSHPTPGTVTGWHMTFQDEADLKMLPLTTPDNSGKIFSFILLIHPPHMGH
jgi:hypothetical protein